MWRWGCPSGCSIVFLMGAGCCLPNGAVDVSRLFNTGCAEAPPPGGQVPAMMPGTTLEDASALPGETWTGNGAGCCIGCPPHDVSATRCGGSWALAGKAGCAGGAGALGCRYDGVTMGCDSGARAIWGVGKAGSEAAICAGCGDVRIAPHLGHGPDTPAICKGTVKGDPQWLH